MPRNGVGTVGYTESSNNTDAHNWLLFKHMEDEKNPAVLVLRVLLFHNTCIKLCPSMGVHMSNHVSTGSS